MPTKKELKKKVLSNIKKKKVVKKKTTKEIPKPIYIMTQKLPREKCCTDVKKTGEAYSIPLGFYDRLGTTRLGTEATKVIPNVKEVLSEKKVEKAIKIPKVPKTVKVPKAEISIESVKGIPILTGTPIAQVSNPITNYFNKKDSKVKKLVTSIENKKMGEEEKIINPRRKIQIVESDEEANVATELPPEPKPKRTYTKKKEGPRSNSLEDYHQRYQFMTGEPFKGEMKAPAFKELVQKMETSVPEFRNLEEP